MIPPSRAAAAAGGWNKRTFISASSGLLIRAAGPDGPDQDWEEINTRHQITVNRPNCSNYDVYFGILRLTDRDVDLVLVPDQLVLVAAVNHV